MLLAGKISALCGGSGTQGPDSFHLVALPSFELVICVVEVLWQL